MWNLSSRIHKLNGFPNQGVTCYVKRDDELSCGISGSKWRKYSSIMPYLRSQGIKHLIIIAGSQSNNLLAALQMAREYQLNLTAFLLKPHTLQIQGNFKLSKLFIKDKDIIWVERDDWFKVNTLAQEYLSTLQCPAYVLDEGASVPEALPGAMSLAKDIFQNELELGQQFLHIFIDAGTGFSAAALIKGLTAVNHQAQIYVLLLADDEALFKKKLIGWLGTNSTNYICLKPHTAKSFGSVNQHIKTEVKRMAFEEGILVDPIYSAKLFHESRRFILSEQLQGNVLIIHSGGVLTLAGFDLN